MLPGIQKNRSYAILYFKSAAYDLLAIRQASFSKALSLLAKQIQVSINAYAITYKALPGLGYAVLWPQMAYCRKKIKCRICRIF